MNWLDDIRVIDLSQYIPGPFATRQLADLGANVIKIEPPGGDPMRGFMSREATGVSPVYRHINRGKRVCRLDLKSDSEHAVFENLLSDADVLLESYRPGVLSRLGFSRERLQQINPGLIHCALSGYGQTGPYRLRGGHDINYLATSGMLAGSGTADRPVANYPPLADHAGAMQASTAILGALYARTKSGKGAFIDISLFESALSWNYLPILSRADRRAEEILNGGAGFYNIYQTADRAFISLGAIETHFWEKFCQAVNRPQWIERHHDPLPQQGLIDDMSELFASHPLAYWDRILCDTDCCYEPLIDTAQVSQHPQVRERRALDQFGPTYAGRINQQTPVIDNNFYEFGVAEIPQW